MPVWHDVCDTPSEVNALKVEDTPGSANCEVFSILVWVLISSCNLIKYMHIYD